MSDKPLSDERILALYDEHFPALKIFDDSNIIACVRACIAEATAWQPIETAPKDGTEVIGMYIHIETQIVHNIFWMPLDDLFPEQVEGWWSYDKSESSRVLLNGGYAPTHWMPLLARPIPVPLPTAQPLSGDE